MSLLSGSELALVVHIALVPWSSLDCPAVFWELRRNRCTLTTAYGCCLYCELEKPVPAVAMQSSLAQSIRVPTARAHRCSSVGSEPSRRERSFPLTPAAIDLTTEKWWWFSSEVSWLMGQRRLLFFKSLERTAQSDAFRLPIFMLTGPCGSSLYLRTRKSSESLHECSSKKFSSLLAQCLNVNL